MDPTSKQIHIRQSGTPALSDYLKKQQQQLSVAQFCIVNCACASI